MEYNYCGCLKKTASLMTFFDLDTFNAVSFYWFMVIYNMAFNVSIIFD